MVKINTFWKLRVSNKQFFNNYTKYAFLKNESIHFGGSTKLKFMAVNGSASKSLHEMEPSFRPVCKNWPDGK